MSNPIVHTSIRRIDAPDGLYINAADLLKAFQNLAVGVIEEDRLTPAQRAEVARGYRAAARRVQSIIDAGELPGGGTT